MSLEEMNTMKTPFGDVNTQKRHPMNTEAEEGVMLPQAKDAKGRRGEKDSSGFLRTVAFPTP
jgi:hypothetical protein